MNSIQPKTKQLVTHYCGCHGNLVTIATRFVADAYCPKSCVVEESPSVGVVAFLSHFYITMSTKC